MIVMKFGGSSVGNADRIKSVVKIVQNVIDKKPIIVASAVGGVTDKLIAAAENAAINHNTDISEIKQTHLKIIKELNLDENMLDKEYEELKQFLNIIVKVIDLKQKLIDYVSSFGERMSCRIIASYFNSINLKSVQYDAYDVGFITDSNWGAAELIDGSMEKISQSFSDYLELPIVTGFIGKNEKGRITTLGRGGSDYTAAIIGCAVDAEEIQIWTDVDGIMTADPRVVTNAQTIKEISFNEAAELATFGARVLHPKTIWPAVKKNIPVRVLNSFKPEQKGTKILENCNICEQDIRSIAFKRNVTLINITSTRMLLAHGFLAKVFRVFESHNISIDMISTSEVSISLTLDNGAVDKKIDNIVEDLEGIAEVSVYKNKALICLVGDCMSKGTGIVARIFNTLSKNDINPEMISQGASEINLGFIIKEDDVEKTVKCLHNEYFG